MNDVFGVELHHGDLIWIGYQNFIANYTEQLLWNRLPFFHSKSICSMHFLNTHEYINNTSIAKPFLLDALNHPVHIGDEILFYSYSLNQIGIGQIKAHNSELKAIFLNGDIHTIYYDDNMFVLDDNTKHRILYLKLKA